MCYYVRNVPGRAQPFVLGLGEATRSGLVFDTENADTNGDTEMGLAPEWQHQSPLEAAVSTGRRAVCPEGRSLAALRQQVQEVGRAAICDSQTDEDSMLRTAYYAGRTEECECLVRN